MMIDTAMHDFRAEAEALIGWWREAGVDAAIAETPRRWLEETGKRETLPIGEDVPRVDAAAPTIAPLPTEHAAFVEWLASDTTLLAAFPPRRRLPPEGHSGAAVMIVTDVPERGDAEAGQLMTGDVGALFDRMLAALKIDRADVYLTTLAPSRPAGAMLDDGAVEYLAPVLRHHIALATPKKLWLMGRAVSRAVLGMDEHEAGGRLHIVNYDAVTVEAIATLHPRVLLREPKSKARVWADMQKLIGTGTA